MAGFSILNTGRIAAYTGSVSHSISNAFFQDTNVRTQSLAIYNAYYGNWIYNNATNFYINRNDPSGRNMYTNNVMTQYGGFRTYSYQHWADTVYYELNISNNTPDDIQFTCNVKDDLTSYTNVFDYTQYGPGNYNSGLTYNGFTPGAANTKFTYQLFVSNLTNPNTFNVVSNVYDYDFNTNYYNNNDPLDFNVQILADYYVPLSWNFDIS
jgi:hypothetical protein